MEARQLTPASSVQEVTDRAGFMALEPEWNALVEATSNELFYRHEFLRIWIDNFAPTAQLRMLTLRDCGGHADGGAAADGRADDDVRHPRAAARPARRTRTRAASILIAREPEAAAAMFLAWLSTDRSWDVLRLTDVPEGGAGW